MACRSSAIDPVLSRLVFGAMGEAERDAALRERMSAMLAQYRELMIQAIRADRERGTVFADAPANVIATLLGAVGISQGGEVIRLRL